MAGPLFSSACLTLTILLPLALSADPLPKAKIPADAKWVLHLDADALRATQVGSYFVKEVLGPKSTNGMAELKQYLDFDLDWTKVRSLTAFGTTHQPKQDNSGILLINTSMDLVKAFRTAIERKNPALKPEEIEGGTHPLFRINNESFAWAGPGNLFVVGKSKDALDHARAAITGSGPKLDGSDLLKGYGTASSPFFFLAVADDFSRETALPSNAAILKKADGGRLLVGERSGKVFADLTVRAQSEDFAQQITQVVQGILALGTLTQDSGKPELQELIRSAKLDRSGKLVTLGIELPISRVIEKIAEKQSQP